MRNVTHMHRSPHPHHRTHHHLRPLPFVLVALALLVGWGVGAPPDPADPPVPDQEEARISTIESSILPLIRVEGRELPPPATLGDRMGELGVAAVSAAVVRDGEVAWARAWGTADVEAGRPANPETLFQAASISKPVAAMGALLLVEDGALQLDGPVNAHLTSWRVPEHNWSGRSEVTLRRLLTHTAVLSVHGFPGYENEAPLPDLPGILDGIEPANTGPVRVSDEPGSLWRYSGGGTTVAQLAISDATGEPFASGMARRVLEPAGMTSSTYEQPLPESLRHRAAFAYRQDGGSPPGGWHVYPEQAAAGLWTTPTDLARWIISVQRSLAASGNPTRKEGAVLRPETALAMVTPGDGDWGLGPAISGEGPARRFSHGGSNLGFKAEMTGWTEGGRGLVVLTNSDQGAILIRELALAIAQEYGWQGYEPRILTALERTEAELAEYAGTYRSESAGFALVVAREEGSLWLITPDGTRREMVSTAEDEFTEIQMGQSVDFLRYDTGRVDAIRVRGLRLDRVEGGDSGP
ncbi:MAG: serine hydrolase [Wenzhouxiangella sp.]|nr:MAG: serine hydrolase [Wenzhouxiangella sp.]